MMEGDLGDAGGAPGVRGVGDANAERDAGLVMEEADKDEDDEACGSANGAYEVEREGTDERSAGGES